ncbi:hypothetical protein WJX73_003375 [Symbiochloris irregularis]|uniref:Cyclopropane-fatty-acyl-phospholipid synthase n=1 Tax=Symbiochloris irregularis TaxID=706552 RepID=A0AAW1PE96_9CHLO
MSVVERDLVSDVVIRAGIRSMLAGRLRQENSGDQEQYWEKANAFVEELRRSPVAINTADANEQHYEVPTEYFLLCLGRHLKYSCCLYPGLDSKLPLGEAEKAMLDLTCERAGLQNGQTVLELGCGWGSVSLYMASQYPNSQITAVSNSKTQREFIQGQCKQRGIRNLEIITADVANFEAPGKYDRVVSVEMFEHMKNYKELLRRISTWLKPNGRLFVHMFCHKLHPYHFEDKGESDWMTRYFFSGGTMVSAGLLYHFQDDLALDRSWWVNGRHYSLTLEAWLKRMDAHRREIMPIMEGTYGKENGLKWWVYWRLFYLACSELFNYSQGNEWGVGHYVFIKSR